MPTMPELKCDWVTHEAAKYACEHWHYSKCMPVAKMVHIGAWEDVNFIGVVLFSYGANNHIGMPYGLQQTECVELTRIALRAHKHFVSEIMMQAVKKLHEFCPGIRLIVSYADPMQGHVGGGISGNKLDLCRANRWQQKIFDKWENGPCKDNRCSKTKKYDRD